MKNHVCQFVSKNTFFYLLKQFIVFCSIIIIQIDVQVVFQGHTPIENDHFYIS
jgi:hypothetical protein